MYFCHSLVSGRNSSGESETEVNGGREKAVREDLHKICCRMDNLHGNGSKPLLTVEIHRIMPKWKRSRKRDFLRFLSYFSQRVPKISNALSASVLLAPKRLERLGSVPLRRKN